MAPAVPIFPTAEQRIRREARTATLRERAVALRAAGWTLARIGVVLGVSATRVGQLLRKAKRLQDQPHWSDALPMRAQNYLIRGRGLDGLAETDAARAIAQFSYRQLLEIPNIGPAACAAVIAWLESHGLALQPQPSRNKTGVPQGDTRLSVSNDGPLPAGPNDVEEPWLYRPATS
jgi:hypothetical protein